MRPIVPMNSSPPASQTLGRGCPTNARERDEIAELKQELQTLQESQKQEAGSVRAIVDELKRKIGAQSFQQSLCSKLPILQEGSTRSGDDMTDSRRSSLVGVETPNTPHSGGATLGESIVLRLEATEAAIGNLRSLCEERRPLSDATEPAWAQQIREEWRTEASRLREELEIKSTQTAARQRSSEMTLVDTAQRLQEGDAQIRAALKEHAGVCAGLLRRIDTSDAWQRDMEQTHKEHVGVCATMLCRIETSEAWQRDFEQSHKGDSVSMMHRIDKLAEETDDRLRKVQQDHLAAGQETSRCLNDVSERLRMLHQERHEGVETMKQDLLLENVELRGRLEALAGENDHVQVAATSLRTDFEEEAAKRAADSAAIRALLDEVQTKVLNEVQTKVDHLHATQQKLVTQVPKALEEEGAARREDLGVEHQRLSIGSPTNNKTVALGLSNADATEVARLGGEVEKLRLEMISSADLDARLHSLEGACKELLGEVGSAKYLQDELREHRQLLEKSGSDLNAKIDHYAGRIRQVEVGDVGNTKRLLEVEQKLDTLSNVASLRRSATNGSLGGITEDRSTGNTDQSARVSANEAAVAELKQRQAAFAADVAHRLDKLVEVTGGSSAPRALEEVSSGLEDVKLRLAALELTRRAGRTDDQPAEKTSVSTTNGCAPHEKQEAGSEVIGVTAKEVVELRQAVAETCDGLARLARNVAEVRDEHAVAINHVGDLTEVIARGAASSIKRAEKRFIEELTAKRDEFESSVKVQEAALNEKARKIVHDVAQQFVQTTPTATAQTKPSTSDVFHLGLEVATRIESVAAEIRGEVGKKIGDVETRLGQVENSLSTAMRAKSMPGSSDKDNASSERCMARADSVRGFAALEGDGSTTATTCIHTPQERFSVTSSTAGVRQAPAASESRNEASAAHFAYGLRGTSSPDKTPPRGAGASPQIKPTQFMQKLQSRSPTNVRGTQEVALQDKIQNVQRSIMEVLGPGMSREESLEKPVPRSSTTMAPTAEPVVALISGNTSPQRHNLRTPGVSVDAISKFGRSPGPVAPHGAATQAPGSPRSESREPWVAARSCGPTRSVTAPVTRTPSTTLTSMNAKAIGSFPTQALPPSPQPHQQQQQQQQQPQQSPSSPTPTSSLTLSRMRVSSEGHRQSQPPSAIQSAAHSRNVSPVMATPIMGRSPKPTGTNVAGGVSLSPTTYAQNSLHASRMQWASTRPPTGEYRRLSNGQDQDKAMLPTSRASYHRANVTTMTGSGQKK